MGNMFSTAPAAPGTKKPSMLERLNKNIDIGGSSFPSLPSLGDMDMLFGKKIIKLSLKQLQKIARRVKISIYKKRKNGIGYTKTPLTKKALKARLSRARVSYKKR